MDGQVTTHAENESLGTEVSHEQVERVVRWGGKMMCVNPDLIPIQTACDVRVGGQSNFSF